MRIGIFGSASDAQCKAVKDKLERHGAEVIIVESQALNLGKACSFDGETFYYRGESLDDVGCWYLRFIMSPLPPSFFIEDNYYLYRDWFIEYMRRRERAGFQLSWLLYLALKGIPVVNPPEHGSVIQLKPFQLAAAKAVGLTIPKTLITNDPLLVKDFVNETGQVVYKPSMGGGLCHSFIENDFKHLNKITAAPVTFQEFVSGTCIRATFIGDELVSSVLLPSGYLDYRADPDYNAGKQIYHQVELPKEIMNQCITLLRNCGLLFSGVDFILRENGSFVFIEANSSPIYLDIENKTQVPISERLACYLLRLSSEPQDYYKAVESAGRTKSFVSYGLPFGTDISIGGRYDAQG